jgi:hypothetical protein
MFDTEQHGLLCPRTGCGHTFTSKELLGFHYRHTHTRDSEDPDWRINSDRPLPWHLKSSATDEVNDDGKAEKIQNDNIQSGLENSIDVTNEDTNNFFIKKESPMPPSPRR